MGSKKTAFCRTLIGIPFLLGAALGTFAFGDAPTLDYCKPAGLQRGTTATIELSGNFDWPIQVDCPGAEVECLDEKGKIEVRCAADVVADRLWLRLFNEEGASVSRPLMLSSQTEVAELEPNNRPSEAQEFATELGDCERFARVVNGVLEKNGDIDCFAVPLRTGQTLVAAVQANASFASPMDAILQVALPDGTVVAENHDAVGLDPRIAFTAPADGTYFVQIFAWPSEPNQQIRYHGGNNYVYRLMLTNGMFATHAAPMHVPANAPKATVRVRGWNVDDAERQPLPYSAVVRSSLAELEPPGDRRLSGAELHVVADAGLANSIRVRRLPEYLAANDARPEPGSGLRIALNQVLFGELESAGDEHRFVVPLKNEQSVRVIAEALSLHSRLVPWLTISDGDNKVLAETKVGGANVDAVLAFTAPADGDYQLRLRDRFQAGGAEYFYRLTLIEPRTDFELLLAEEQYVLSATEPLQLEIKLRRRDGNAGALGDIRVEAVDLPPGVTCESVVSEAMADTKDKVTLTLTSNGQPFSGRVRVRGTAAELDLVRYAVTPERLDTTFGSLWLTALPTAAPADEP